MQSHPALSREPQWLSHYYPRSLSSYSWPPVPQRVGAHGHLAHGLKGAPQAVFSLCTGVLPECWGCP